jgi:hypothetical protein
MMNICLLFSSCTRKKCFLIKNFFDYTIENLMLTSRAQTSITFSPLQSNLIVPEVDCATSLKEVVWGMATATVDITESCHLPIYFPNFFLKFSLLNRFLQKERWCLDKNFVKRHLADSSLFETYKLNHL